MEIPQIDISPLINGGFEGVDDVISQIKVVCEGISCFYITGHGIDESLMKNVMKRAREFFNLPMDKKVCISLKKSTAYRGYIQQGSEKTASKVDVKEGIYFGPESYSEDPDSVTREPMMGANQFPDEKELPGFATTIRTFINKMSLVGHSIMRGLALSLKFNDDYFHDKFNPAFPLLALWHYPPVPEESDSWGVGPHTDYGVLTILMQDDVGGLQVETSGGDWIDVTPIPGTFVVNVGDVMEAWTEGKFRATMHRVKNSSSKHRISAPFFFQPSLDCVIKPLDDVIATESAGKDTSTKLALHKPFKFGEYVLNKFQKSYGDN